MAKGVNQHVARVCDRTFGGGDVDDKRADARKRALKTGFIILNDKAPSSFARQLDGSIDADEGAAIDRERNAGNEIRLVGS